MAAPRPRPWHPAARRAGSPDPIGRSCRLHPSPCKALPSGSAAGPSGSGPAASLLHGDEASVKLAEKLQPSTARQCIGVEGARPMRLRTILETVLYVDDLDAAARFYGGLLGLEQVSAKAGVFVFLRLDRQMLLLFDPDAAGQARGVPAHGARGRDMSALPWPPASWSPGPRLSRRLASPSSSGRIGRAVGGPAIFATLPATAWSWRHRESGAFPASYPQAIRRAEPPINSLSDGSWRAGAEAAVTRRCAGSGTPGLVVAGGVVTLAAAERVSWRHVGGRRAGQVRHVLLLPEFLLEGLLAR